VLVLVLLLVIDLLFGSSTSTITKRIFLSSLHRRTPGAYVPNLMRSFLRKACLVLATGSLVFFLSCERHHVGELPDEHETKAPAEEHASTTHESHASPSPAARNTPANFFPDKPKP
jgi:hypothetical protein